MKDKNSKILPYHNNTMTGCLSKATSNGYSKTTRLNSTNNIHKDKKETIILY